MGGSISKQIQDNFKKQQEFQAEMQRVQLERQMTMRLLMQERAAAMEIAKSRDLTFYFGAFAAGLALICVPLYLRKQQNFYLVPVFASICVVEYHYKIAFGDRAIHHRKIAQDMLLTPNVFDLPNGPITFEEIESRRDQLIDNY